MAETMHIMHQLSKRGYAHGAFDRNMHCVHHAGMSLERIRKARGLSQRDLAEMIGKDQSTIARAEREDPSAKLTTYKMCAEALGVTLEDIFSESRSAAEAALIKAFREIPEGRQDRVLAILDLIQQEDGSQHPET